MAATNRVRRISLAAVGLSAAALAGQAMHAANATADKGAGPGMLPGRVLVSSPPSGDKGPDDITSLATRNVDHGHLVIWTAYQNGISARGAPAGARSTVAGYDAHNGHLIATIGVTGKVDGLTADAKQHRLIATVNEDGSSALDLIDVGTSAVTAYAYSPNPETGGNGGTDSIAVWRGGIFIVHSNPNDTSQPAVYSVTLDSGTHTANLTPLYNCDSTATDGVSGTSGPLALTDPDTNAVVPDAAPRFGGQLALISQGDGQMVFAAGTSSPSLTLLNLRDSTGEVSPPIDGFAVATADEGTLYVVDNKAGTITALHTNGWGAGTVFVGEPDDSNNPLIGTLDLFTGRITPLGNAFGSPKGLLFVPNGD